MTLYQGIKAIDIMNTISNLAEQCNTYGVGKALGRMAGWNVPLYIPYYPSRKEECGTHAGMQINGMRINRCMQCSLSRTFNK